MQQINWITAPRTLSGGNTAGLFKPIDHRYTELTEEQIHQLPVKPLPHQRKTIRAMIDLENNPAITVGGYTIQTNAGVLSERPGSGKSYEILATILLNPNTTKRMQIRACSNKTEQRLHKFRRHRRDENYIPEKTNSLGQFGSSRLLAFNTVKMLNVNIIFVAKNVINQWRVYIGDYCPDINFLVVTKFEDLVKLSQIIHTKEINKYRIILVKHTITTSKQIQTIYPPAAEHNRAAMLDIVRYMFKNILINRVVIDDFDVINVKNDGLLFAANFTWLISATTNNTRHRIAKRNNNYNVAMTNRLLLDCFNIKCTDDYVDLSCSQSVVTHNIYGFESDMGNLRSAISLLNPEIADLVNGDAVARAGQELRLGTDNPTISDIFYKLFTGQYKKMIRARAEQERARELLSRYDTLVADTVPGHQPTARSLNAMRIALDQRDYNKFISCVQYKCNAINALVTEHLGDITAATQDVQNKIQRIMDTFQEGDCPITCEPLANSKVIIIRCCGFVISDKALSCMDISAGCPNCKSTIQLRDCISLDLSGIDINTKELTDVAADGESDDESEVKETYSVEDLLGIVDGVTTTGTHYGDEKLRDLSATKANAPIKLMLLGDCGIQPRVSTTCGYDMGWPAITRRKWLIFCSDTTVVSSIVSSGFNTYNIRYGVLRGRMEHLAEIIARYRRPETDPTSIKVLFIITQNGNHAYAGLDLQITTDIIFTNKYINKNLQRQMIGRAHRIGRTTNLRIHYLCYNNEVLEDADLPLLAENPDAINATTSTYLDNAGGDTSGDDDSESYGDNIISEYDL